MIARKVGIAGADVGGVVVKADLVVSEGAVRGVGPHMPKDQNGCLPAAKGTLLGPEAAGSGDSYAASAAYKVRCV